MAKVYKLSDAPDIIDLEQETIVITEEKAVTETKRVTIAQLRQEYAQYVQQIEQLKTMANAVVDTIIELDDKVEGLDIENIPAKLN